MLHAITSEQEVVEHEREAERPNLIGVVIILGHQLRNCPLVHKYLHIPARTRHVPMYRREMAPRIGMDAYSTGMYMHAYTLVCAYVWT